MTVVDVITTVDVTITADAITEIRNKENFLLRLYYKSAILLRIVDFFCFLKLIFSCRFLVGN